MRILAQHAGQLINYSSVGAVLGMNHVTTRKYTGAFESLFIIHTLPPWHSNRLDRLTTTAKLHFLDSGLLAAMCDLTPSAVQANRTRFGPIFETFVLAELLKLASWADSRFEFSHFRDKDQNEVNVVIEDRQGRVVGIEVKAAASVTSADFNGLRKLAADCGERFVLGLVLYDHNQSVPFGDRLVAAPIAMPWR